jgi:excisionase family DNA binding protein
MEIERQLTITEVAELLRKKPQVIESMVRGKKLPGFKVGGSWRFSPADLMQWIESQKGTN